MTRIHPVFGRPLLHSFLNHAQFEQTGWVKIVHYNPNCTISSSVDISFSEVYYSTVLASVNQSYLFAQQP